MNFRKLHLNINTNKTKVWLLSTWVFMITFLGTGTRSSAAEINFQNISLEQAKKKALESNKLIFVDAYTTWCGPCKWMAAKIFTNDEVAEIYSSNFICLKIDMEKGEGIDFAKKYAIEAYPTFVFLDGEGHKVHQTCGSKEAAAFVSDAKNALNPETQLIGYQNRYANESGDFNFLKAYALVLDEAGMNSKEIITALLRFENKEELINEMYFSLLAENSELNNDAFQFIMENKKRYEELIGVKKMNDFIENTFLLEAEKAAKRDDPSLLTGAEKSLEIYHIENAKEFMLHMHWHYAQLTKTNMFENAQVYINNFKQNDSEELNSAAWAIFENSKDKKELEAATLWAKKSVELKPNYANLDTYANLLHKLGRNDEALEAVKESIIYGEKEEQNLVESEKLKMEISAALNPKKK